ncbi:MAG: ABC transporter permease subunit [Alphaproteobacteria bacterium]|nr:ABC transporter permease subunit [Alphaproteobacteria bacterium]
MSEELAVETERPSPKARGAVSPLRLPFLLTLPTLVVVFVIFGIPLIYALALSLHRINMLTQQWMFVGLANYTDILPDPAFLAAFGRTAYFALVTVLGGLVLGMAMALVLNLSFPGRNVLRSIVLVPWAMAPVAVGVLWSWMFNGEYGTLNAILFDLGLIEKPIHWLGNGTVAFNLVALVHIWNQAPLATLLILAGLQSMPENLHRAARIDGAGAIRRFFSITLPWLRPMLLLIMILTTINSIMAFDLFWIMTKGGPGSATTVFSWMGYAYAYQFFKFGEGAAILFMLTIICLILAWFYMRLFFPTVMRKDVVQPAGATGLASTLVNRVSAAGADVRTRFEHIVPKVHRRFLSGRTRRVLGWVGIGVAALLIFFWSFAPFVWLVLMSLSPPADLVRSPPTMVPNGLTLENYRFVLFPGGVEDGQSSIQATRVPFAIWNSLIVAISVTAINLVLGALAGYAYARHAAHSRLMNGTLWGLMMTRMTPSLALILPFFMMFKAFGILDTRTALVIAYCSLILPLSTWMMKGYFEGLPPNLERAALVDGCTRLQAIWKVIAPVARPGIVAAGIFCFLVSWNEFIFALILTGTPKAQTIPVVIAGFLVQLRFYDYGPMFAASVLAVIPPVVIALAFQRYLVRGMLSGSLKG